MVERGRTLPSRRIAFVASLNAASPTGQPGWEKVDLDRILKEFIERTSPHYSHLDLDILLPYFKLMAGHY